MRRFLRERKDEEMGVIGFAMDTLASGSLSLSLSLSGDDNI